jgi:hypothetical protein
MKNKTQLPKEEKLWVRIPHFYKKGRQYKGGMENTTHTKKQQKNEGGMAS